MYWCPYRHSKDRRRAFNRKNQRAYASWIACLFRFIALVFICIFLDCMSCLFKFSALVLDCIFAKLIHVFSQGDDGLGDDVEVELPAPMPVGRVGGGSVLWQIFFLIFHWSVDWSYFGFFLIFHWSVDSWSMTHPWFCPLRSHCLHRRRLRRRLLLCLVRAKNCYFFPLVD